METAKVNMRARYTGNREIAYRWVGEVGSGKVCHAQSFPGAEIVSDTWSDQVDARMSRSTKVALPAGLLVIDSCKRGGSHSYTAGLLTGEDAKNTIDWTRAQYVETRQVEIQPGNPRAGKTTVHVVTVDGVRAEYREIV